MTAQQLHDLGVLFWMGLAMAACIVLAILVERRKEIRLAREADALDAHENSIIDAWVPGLGCRDELRPGR